MAELETSGIGSMAIARQDDEGGRWRFLGILSFLDPPCPDAKRTMEHANLLGVEVMQLPTLVRCSLPVLGGRFMGPESK